MRSWIAGSFALLLLSLGGASTSAQRRSATPISALTALDCAFVASAEVVWSPEGPRVNVRQTPRLEFRIGNIDASRGGADFMFGAVTIRSTMLSQGSTLHFVEPPENGAMATASVVVDERARRLRASYSRTEYYAYSGPGFTSMPRAAQYYGYCDATFR